MFTYLSGSLPFDSNNNRYALIDCTIDPGVLPRVAHRLTAANHVNLFSGAFAEGAEAYAPVLIDLEAKEDGRQGERQAFLQTLVTACVGKPMLSFLSTRAALDELAEHLRKLLLVKTSDEQTFLLRYADTRMLPAICSTWNDAQRAAFFGPIGTWWAVDHYSEVSALTVPHTGSHPGDLPEYPLELNDVQLSMLLAKTELYAMVAQLEQRHPSFPDSLNLAERIQFVERNAQQAMASGFEDAADRLAWCSSALHGGERFHTHEPIVPLLDQARANALPLNEQLAAISPEQWQVIRARHDAR